MGTFKALNCSGMEAIFRLAQQHIFELRADEGRASKINDKIGVLRTTENLNAWFLSKTLVYLVFALNNRK